MGGGVSSPSALLSHPPTVPLFLFSILYLSVRKSKNFPFFLEIDGVLEGGRGFENSIFFIFVDGGRRREEGGGWRVEGDEPPFLVFLRTKPPPTSCFLMFMFRFLEPFLGEGGGVE